MRKLTILGSTGSIGTQTLDVVEKNSGDFCVAALAARSNDALLEKQIEKFAPQVAVLADEAAARRLKERYTGKTEILGGRGALLEIAALPEADLVVTSLVGFAGLEPTIRAIQAGKDIALANKETLVVAGELVMRLAKEHGISILPVDSEHSAIFQCLQGEEKSEIARIFLTASGGPFRGRSREELGQVTVEECLKHPNWTMGSKITVDSATLANKGLEVIEAKWLYGVEYEQIEAVVHPQSIIHSLVEFTDGTVKAQLGVPDMRIPIQYALTYPTRRRSPFPRLALTQLKELTFEEPDVKTFLALDYAYEAGRIGGTMPCVFNAANEVAVYAFLQERLSFLEIYAMIKETMNAHTPLQHPDLETLLEADRWARAFAAGLIDAKK